MGAGTYARALADEIVKPGIDSMLVFTRVGRRVQSAIGQDPFLSASTMPEVYFAGVKSADPQPQQVQSTEAERAWAAIRDSTSVAVLEAFITRYKDTFYGALARAHLEELKKQQTAILTPTPAKPPARTPSDCLGRGAHIRRAR